MLQVLVFIFCLKQNIIQLHFWPLCQVFNTGVLLGDFLSYRVISVKDYPIIPAKATLIQSSLCSCSLYFLFFAAGKSVISSLFSWFHLLLRGFFHTATEGRKYFPKPNFKSNYCIDLLILNSPLWGPAL